MPYRTAGPRAYAQLVRHELQISSSDAEGVALHLAHVRTADFPEPPCMWAQLGRDAGFPAVRDLFPEPTDFYGILLRP
jgi:hypothetical protein